MKKKFIAILAILLIAVGCGQKPAESKVLKVSGIEPGYGTTGWELVVEAFEAETGIEVELELSKNIHEVLRPELTAGNAPDVIYLALNATGKLTDTMVAEEGVLEITDLLDMDVLSESVKVKDKVLPGFFGTLSTSPYLDGKTFLAPMFYSPTGLFYNQTLLTEKGWTVPTTWDEMWTLGDLAKSEGIALFTYPTAGYLDAFMAGLLNSMVGQETFNKLMSYDIAAWENPKVLEAFEIVGKLASYTHPDTVAQANGEGFTKNQGMIIDKTALFMPNGTWVANEMKDAEWPGADEMVWGLTALPSIEAGGDRYSTTFSEQVWIPKDAVNVDNAKLFISFLYSDTAAKLFYENGGAVQPIVGSENLLTDADENKPFYNIYADGAKSNSVGFAAHEPVEGVELGDIFYNTIDEVAAGTKTPQQWYESVVEAIKKFQ